jgi:hypothetical protein
VIQSNSWLAEGVSDIDFVVDDILFNCRPGAPAPNPEFLPLEKRNAAKGVKLSARAIGKYCRSYSNGGTTFSVKREEGSLVLSGFVPNYRFRLQPMTPELFHVEDIDMDLFFSLDGKEIPRQARIHKSPLAKEMLDAITQSGMEEAKRRFPEWRGRIRSLEEMIDLSRELRLKGIDDLEILMLSAEVFPYSFHAQESLNRALIKKGGLAASAAALETIVDRLRAQGLANTKAEWLQEIIRSQADPRPMPPDEMDEYAGDFGARHIAREGDALVYFVDSGRKTRLFWIHAEEFSLQGQFFRRLRFIRDERGRVMKLIVNYYRDSYEESPRTEGDRAADAQGTGEK